MTENSTPLGDEIDNWLTKQGKSDETHVLGVDDEELSDDEVLDNVSNLIHETVEHLNNSPIFNEALQEMFWSGLPGFVIFTKGEDRFAVKFSAEQDRHDLLVLARPAEGIIEEKEEERKLTTKEGGRLRMAYWKERLRLADSSGDRKVGWLFGGTNIEYQSETTYRTDNLPSVTPDDPSPFYRRSVVNSKKALAGANQLVGRLISDSNS
jgi:hypothetical protein